jgi:hypothetical protein
MIGRADHQGVDIGIGDHVAPVGPGAASVVGGNIVAIRIERVHNPFGLAQPPAIHVADDNHLHAGNGQHLGQVGAKCLATGADEAHVDAIAGRAGTEYACRNDGGRRNGGEGTSYKFSATDGHGCSKAK